MAADFRRHFGISIMDMGRDYTYLEAYLLLVSLLKDVSTRTGAAYHKLKYPITKELEALGNLYDLTLVLGTSPDSERMFYPTPWPQVEPPKRTPEEKARLDALFAQMNPAT